MSSTGGMGRGSDTRMYSPRSESSHMYSANEGDEKYNPTDPEYKEREKDKKLQENDEKEARHNKIKHIKILGHHGRGSGNVPQEESEADTELDPRRDLQGELSRQTGPPGNRGHELDLATGAKTGTGSAMGSRVATGEPMDYAWSELLKMSEAEMLTYYNPVNTADRYSDRRYAKTGKKLSPGMREEIMQNQKDRGERKLEAGIPSHLMYAHHDYPPMLEARMKIPEEKLDLLPYEAHERNKIADLQDIAPKIGMHPRAVYNNQRMFSQMIPEEFTMRDSEPDDIQPSPIPGMVYINGELVSDPRIKNTSEPMDYAWSELLKRETPKTMAARRKREKRSEFRPSTGQFKKPPGGQSGGPGSTMRRFKARMRGIASGKKTGLMKPHLAVEMSHRGIATKQPMSKDPAPYRAYMGQQEAKKILGGARTVWSPHARYGERSTRAGPTGGGQLTGLSAGQAGQMRQPSLRRMRRPRMPRMRRPRMPRSMNPMGMQPMGSMSALPPLPQAPPMEDPSQIMMSDFDKSDLSHSDLLKMSYSDLTELRTLLRRIARAKEQEAKESKKKAGTTSATEGAMPSHPAGIHGDSDDEDPDGPTENLETKANRLGLDPAGIVSRRGHMG